jgi:hypothetical protein
LALLKQDTLIEGATANSKSAVHALDIRSRKVLTDCMSSAAMAALDPQEKGRVSKEINAARKDMLARPDPRARLGN